MTSKVHAQFIEKVNHAIASHSLLTEAKHICVGFSGGADSTALLLALLHQPVTLEAVHLNHGMRKTGADKDAAWCERFCGERNIPFSCHALNVQGERRPGESIETAARRCRLAFWRKYLAEPGQTGKRTALPSAQTAVALGHHADDALEDMFLRMGRGSGVSGLTGLKPVRQIGKITFIRPLLYIRRCEILNFLEAADITDWCRDHTNLNTDFRRNAVRHKLLPAVREIWGNDAGFLQSLSALREDAAFLEEAAARRQTKILTADLFAETPPALQPRILRLWLTKQVGYDCVPRRAAIERLRAAAAAPPAKGVTAVPLGNHLTLEVDCQLIRLQESAPSFKARYWYWQDQPVCNLPELKLEMRAELVPPPSRKSLKNAGLACEYFDPDQLAEPLMIRPWKAGDRMIPFGHTTERKIKDFLNAAGIPPLERRRIPILTTANDEIIWIAGVRRSSAALPASRETGKARVLRITLAEK